MLGDIIIAIVCAWLVIQVIKLICGMIIGLIKR